MHWHKLTPAQRDLAEAIAHLPCIFDTPHVASCEKAHKKHPSCVAVGLAKLDLDDHSEALGQPESVQRITTDGVRYA